MFSDRLPEIQFSAQSSDWCVTGFSKWWWGPRPKPNCWEALGWTIPTLNYQESSGNPVFGILYYAGITVKRNPIFLIKCKTFIIPSILTSDSIILIDWFTFYLTVPWTSSHCTSVYLKLHIGRVVLCFMSMYPPNSCQRTSSFTLILTSCHCTSINPRLQFTVSSPSISALASGPGLLRAWGPEGSKGPRASPMRSALMFDICKFH